LRALAARLNAVREEERIRISRQVHDQLGQLLTGLKMDLAWMSRHLRGVDALEPATVEILNARIGEAVGLVDTTVQTVQAIATELRPAALDSLGLAAALRDEARRFETRTGVKARVTVVEVAPPDPEAGTALFRIFQEILTNAARHARASAVRIDLDCGAEASSLLVRDNGVGFQIDLDRRPGHSLGLWGMQERAEILGGEFNIQSVVGEGTTVSVRIPREFSKT
jgi:signal transduction histidine kinase